MKSKIGLIAAGIGISFLASTAYAGGEDIYPAGFIEDCEYASVDADFSAKLLEFTGNEVDKQKAGKAFSAMCGCLADKFFSRSYEDVPYAYEVYITAVQYNGHINAPVRLKNLAGRDINQCNIEANKSRVNKGIEKFDKEQKALPKNDLRAEFMSDIRSSLGKGANEGYLRKADYLSKCFVEKVDEYRAKRPELVPGIIPRLRQNLKAGTFVNVPVTAENRQVEIAVLRIDDNCW